MSVSTATSTPRILDCGANVGLASLFFRRLYPQARITAFEADPALFAILEANLDANGRTNTPPPAQPAPKPVPPSPSPSAQVETGATVVMYEQNGSHESGTATLTAMTEGKTQVVLAISGMPKGASQPAHIHVGTCADLGAVSLPLSNVVDGSSMTVLNVSLASILHAATSMAINVHKSETEITSYVACGDITGSGYDQLIIGADRGASPEVEIIDLKTGAAAHWLKIEGIVHELYDVVALPNTKRPMALGLKTDEIRRLLTIEGG